VVGHHHISLEQKVQLAARFRQRINDQPQLLLPERRQGAAKIHRDEEDSVSASRPVNV
jgi:hypothetical protein